MRLGSLPTATRPPTNIFPLSLRSPFLSSGIIVLHLLIYISGNLLILHHNEIQLGVNYETAFPLMRFIGKVFLAPLICCCCSFSPLVNLGLLKKNLKIFNKCWTIFHQDLLSTCKLYKKNSTELKTQLTFSLQLRHSQLNYDEQTRETASAVGTMWEEQQPTAALSVARRTFNFFPFTFNLIKNLLPPLQPCSQHVKMWKQIYRILLQFLRLKHESCERKTARCEEKKKEIICWCWHFFWVQW